MADLLANYGAGANKPTTSAGQAIQNLPSSFGNVVKGIGTAIAHPIDTLSNLGQLAIGETEKGIGKVAGGLGLPTGNVDTTTPVGNFNANAQNKATQFNANFMGGLFAGKGPAGLNEKFATDPAGLLLDISTLADGIGGSLDAGAALADSPTFAKLGDVSHNIADVTNPISAVTKPIGGVIKKLGTPSETVASNISALKDLGVNPSEAPIQALAGQGVMSTAANFVKSGLFGKGITDQVDTLVKDLGNKTDELVNSFPTSLDNPTLGQKIIDAKNAFEGKQGAITDKLYGAIEEKYGSAPAQTSNTIGAIDAQIKQLETSTFPATDGLIKKLNTMKDNLIYGRGDYSSYMEQGYTPEALKRMGITQEYSPTVDTLKATRTSIGRQIGKDNVDSPVFKPIYAALTQDRLATVSKIDPQAAADIVQADTVYKRTIEKLSNKTSSLIDNATPESIVQKFISGNNSTQLEALKSIVDPGTFAQVGTSWLHEIVRKATDPTSGELNIKKFLDTLNGLDAPTRNALFEPEQISRLNQVADTLTKINKVKDSLVKNTTPGKFMQNAMLLRTIGLPITILAGGGSTFFNYLMGMQGGEYLASKLFTTKLGKTMLLTGSKAVAGTGKLVQTAGKVTAKAAQVSNIVKQAK